MQIGIFAKTFARPTVNEILDAVKSHGIKCIQFNMACAGLPPMPDTIDSSLCNRIHKACEDRGIVMAAVSGTFNMIHPDRRVRKKGLSRLQVLAAACPLIGTRVITLCTGSRDPEDMWRRHPDNDSPAAWNDLLATMRIAAEIATEFDVILGVEPEVANVVDSAIKARRLLDALQSPRVRIVMDPANLFHKGELPRMAEILDDAFKLLGRDIVLAHAKDLSHDGEAGHEAAGKGLLDYDRYLHLLRSCGYDGPVILHGLAESQVAECVAFLKGKLNDVSAAT